MTQTRITIAAGILIAALFYLTGTLTQPHTTQTNTQTHITPMVTTP